MPRSSAPTATKTTVRRGRSRDHRLGRRQELADAERVVVRAVEDAVALLVGFAHPDVIEVRGEDDGLLAQGRIGAGNDRRPTFQLRELADVADAGDRHRPVVFGA